MAEDGPDDRWITVEDENSLTAPFNRERPKASSLGPSIVCEAPRGVKLEYGIFQAVNKPSFVRRSSSWGRYCRDTQIKAFS